MNIIDTEIHLTLTQEFTPIKDHLQKIIKDESLHTANIVCWVPHEVSSLVQIGWEDGLLEDLKDFLKHSAPAKTWKHHDEPGTPFRYNFHEHIRTKMIGTISLTLIIKEGKLYIGTYQDLYFYSPVFKHIPQQKIFCRITKYE